MRKNIIFITVCLTLIYSPHVWAEDSFDPLSNSPDKTANQSGFIMPQEFIAYKEIVEGEIAKKNAMEFFNHDIEIVNYNKDGTIGFVKYTDGTKVDYSYEYGKDGRMQACTLESENVKISFKVAKTKHRSTLGDNGKKNVDIEIYIKEHLDAGDDNPPGMTPDDHPSSHEDLLPSKNKPIIVYHSTANVNLNEVARKPIKFDFKEIKKAVSMAAKLRDDAVKEYEKNTAQYYAEVGTELKNRFAGCGEEDAKLASLLMKVDEKEPAAQEARKTVDEAVDYIRSSAKVDGVSQTKEEFLIFENGLRERILTPATEIYEGRIDAAVEYITIIIDKLIGSRLAVYFDLKKDKIDVIINLKKPLHTTEEEKK